jgi:mannose-6-phosphate isomerase
LMANSDNVLRGGLTSKHIDINELIQQVKFKPTYPSILKGQKRNDFETEYACPVPDFGITKITIPEGESYTMNSDSLEILLVTEGELQVEELSVKAGEAVMLPAGQGISLKAITASVLFKSYVP